MQTSLSSPPRWTRRKEARPEELLDAALSLFVERGFVATRAEDVAARAEVSKGTVYFYYANKEELFKAVVRSTLVSIIQEGQALVKDYQGSSSDLLRMLMLTWWDRVGTTKASGLCKLVMAEAGNFPELARFYYEEVIAPAHALFHAVLQRGIDRQEFRTIDLAMTTHTLMAPVLLTMMWQHSFAHCCQEPMPDPRAQIEYGVGLLLKGLLQPALLES
ncbi:MAG: TetR/AcrR family transcriptional regulator, partial [Burkholderiales bacterium]